MNDTLKPASAARDDRTEGDPDAVQAVDVRVIELPELTSPDASAPAAPVLHDVHPLHHVRTLVQVRVGSIALSVGELLCARHNQIFSLDRALDDEVDLLVEGAVVARGKLVAVEHNFAVQITQLPRHPGLNPQKTTG